jgi:Domain of unknown function (DUF5710)
MRPQVAALFSLTIKRQVECDRKIMTATSNIPLNVPFKEKDEAKSLGARWNPDAKHWYIPEGVDATPFEKWFDGASVPTSAPTTTSTTRLNNATSSLPADADMDNINAMLRDAYEVSEEQ